MDRLGYTIVRAVASCVLPALGALLVVQALNSVQGRTLLTPGWAAACGAIGGCIAGLNKSLKGRREDH